MFQPFNRDSQIVLKQAKQLAQTSDGVVVPMHVLHALITKAPAVWNEVAHLDMHSLRGALPALDVSPEEPSTAASAALSNSVKRVLAYAMEECYRARAGQIPPESVKGHIFPNEFIGPEFILLGLMRESECDAAQLLTSQGLSLEEIRGRFSKTEEL